jgi:hypothetical protein
MKAISTWKELNNWLLNDALTTNSLDESIKSFIFENTNENTSRFEVKEDEDKLGIIVDIWDKEFKECINTAAFWREDFTED